MSLGRRLLAWIAMAGASPAHCTDALHLGALVRARADAAYTIAGDVKTLYLLEEV